MDTLATVDDVIRLFRGLKPEEKEKAEALIPIVSDILRIKADEVGKDLDEMASESKPYANVVKSVICDVVARNLMTSTDQEPMTQYAEAALGYSYSGSFLVPGGGLFIKRNELKRLGLLRQKTGVIEPYGEYNGGENGTH